MSRCIIGDCLDVLPTLESGSAQMCVTSPPYWGLRDYGTATWEGGVSDCDHLAPKAGGTGPASAVQVQVKRVDFESGGHYRGICKKCGARRIDGQLGLESTPEEYVAKMVAVFREVRRVLRDDGTLWLNLGDSYAGGGNYRGINSENTLTAKQSSNRGARGLCQQLGAAGKDTGLKPKDLVGIPWRVAFALQADGWWLRQDIIWAKPNPMPESVRDRCTKAHEYIFLLSKSKRYYFDAAVIAEPLAYGSVERLSQPGIEDQAGSDRVPGKTNGNMKAVYKEPYRNQSTKDYGAGGAQDASATKARIVDRILAGEIVARNKRSVWTVATQPYSEAHFATFPSALVEPCVLAGSKPGDVVLDPFGGSGTVGQVAESLGRQWLLIELNPEYEKLSRERTAQQGMTFQTKEPQCSNP